MASQSEMGQGSTTTLAAALADELYLSLDAVRIEFAPFAPAYRDPVYNWMFTGNSQSTSSFYDVMRQMGAAAREMLLTAAASRWKTPVDGLKLSDGKILHPDGRRTLTYGQVASDAAKLPVPGRPALRAQMPSAGRALRRWDVPGKVDGSAEFGIDVKCRGCCWQRCVALRVLAQGLRNMMPPPSVPSLGSLQSSKFQTVSRSPQIPIGKHGVRLTMRS
jgi:isoquinoline 1-oxidoreductase beta subunit